VPRGYGIGFAEGLTIFVPLSAPGDRLHVRLVNIKKRTAFAEIDEIIEPGPERAEPRCPYFGTCGGCDFQQLTYAAQLDAKAAMIRDCLRRIGKIDYEGQIGMIASETLGYRTRARWQIDRESASLAYFARDSHRLVPVRTCPKLVAELRSIVENFDLDNETGLGDELLAAAGDAGSVSMFSPPGKPKEISVTVGAENYLGSAEVFFQSNRFLLGELVDAAVGTTGGGTAFDLYCGVGLFTLPLARHFEKVIAVESLPKAVEFARHNVSNARLDNVKVLNSTVTGFLANSRTTEIDLVLLDPPRTGDDRQVIDAIATLKPARISYVSCEPSILARDLRVLVDAGYNIDKITALDMFPQTHHVETVAQLSLADFVP